MDFNDFLECNGVVVQRTGAMGDVIWTTPLFKYMRDAGFKGSITVATQHPEVFQNNPHVTNVVSPACVRNALGQEGVWDLDWAYESNRNKHMLEAYCNVLGIDYMLVEKQPLLYQDDSDHQWVHETVLSGSLVDCRGTVVIHAAASPDRTWSCLRWEKLSDHLIKLGFFVICVGAANDYHLQPRREVLDLIGLTTLGKVTALIEHADAFIGIDSGIANAAFSTQTPSIVLYGMAAAHTRLPGTCIHYGVRANPTDCDCLGCLNKLPVHAPPLCHNFQKAKCMDLISVDDVIDAFVELREHSAEIP